jgi:hypothetical protein
MPYACYCCSGVTLILILKRDDLLLEHRNKAVDSLRLEDASLPPEVIEQAELIVFVEGTGIKFLKHHHGIQSKDNAYVLFHYIISSPPVTEARKPYVIKRYRRKKKE